MLSSSFHFLVKSHPCPVFIHLRKILNTQSVESSKTVKPYHKEGSKKLQVSRMFDNIAPWYDFLNHFLSLGIDIRWRKTTVRALRKFHPGFLLDVATGTADLALEAYRTLKPHRIIGLDISEEMLSVGRSKIAKRGLGDSIELVSGDCENLPFESNTFDAITVAFGVRNFEDLDQGLKEMKRVLKPDGHVAILEFSSPTLFPFKKLYNFYFKNLLPLIGRITSKDPKAYSYLYESVQAFPNGKEFAERLESIGFQGATYKPLTLGICTLYLAKK